MSTVLLLVIALVAPWTVHLAPPRQRPLALVGVVAVLLLYGIFAQNPLVRWELWAGLAAGVLTVALVAAAGSGGGRSRRRGRRSPGPPARRRRSTPAASPLEEAGNQPTGEL